MDRKAPYTDLYQLKLRYRIWYGKYAFFFSNKVYTMIYYVVLVYHSIYPYIPLLSHFWEFPLGIQYYSLSWYKSVYGALLSIYYHIPTYTIA